VKRAAIAALVVALAGPAHADKADTLFKKAKRLLADKRYAEACKTFEDVVKLDPKAIGGLLNAGKCYEEWGQLARAYTWYEKALTTAAEAKDDREPKIKELLDELDVNVPRLTIKVPEGADLAIVATLTLDGRPVDQATLGQENRVDPGPHVIEFTVDGKKKKKMAPVERGGSSEITVDIPKAKPKGPDEPEETPVVPPPTGDPGRGRKIAGIVVGSAGIVAIGIAGGLTLQARGKYLDAIDQHCGGSPSNCTQEGLDITRDARSRANVMTVVTLVGVAAVAGGVILYLTAPKAGVYVAPEVTGDGAGAVLGGTF
jgi:hypothetical protein